jgi:hypothetical protein
MGVMVPDKTDRVKTAFFAGLRPYFASIPIYFKELTIGTTIALKGTTEPACVAGFA